MNTKAPGTPSGPIPIVGALAPSGGLQAQDLAEAVCAGGLRRIGVRPRLLDYLRDVWRRRWFIWELASGNAYTRNQDNRLGQFWAVLNPLLSVGSYYLIFGVLLETTRGVDNYIGFLTVGIFIFSFMNATLTVGSRSVLRNPGLLRALRFPRVALPIAAVITEMLILLPAIGVLLVILPITGEPLTLNWLLLPVALILLHIFCTGAAMAMARLVAGSRDLDNLVPVIMRIARYVSGVFFSVSAYAGTGAIGVILQYQPLALFIDLVRSCLMTEVPLNPLHWYVAIGWAIVAVGCGGFFFWRGEGTYGRA